MEFTNHLIIKIMTRIALTDALEAGLTVKQQRNLMKKLIGMAIITLAKQPVLNGNTKLFI